MNRRNAMRRVQSLLTEYQGRLGAVLAASSEEIRQDPIGVIVHGAQQTVLLVVGPEALAEVAAGIPDPEFKREARDIVGRPANGLLRVLVYDMEARLVAGLRISIPSGAGYVVPG